MKQPNFDEIFFENFNNRKIKRYIIRNNSNMPHDIHFLNSLIHDAYFKIQDIENTAKTFVYFFEFVQRVELEYV